MATVGAAPSSPLGSAQQPRPPSGSRSTRPRQSIAGQKPGAGATVGSSTEQLAQTLSRTLPKAQLPESPSAALFTKATNALLSEEITAPDGGDNRVRALSKTSKQVAQGLRVREAGLLAGVLAAARACLLKSAQPSAPSAGEIHDGVVALLSALTTPLVCGRTSEAWVESKGIVSLLNELSQLLLSPHPDVVFAALKALEALYQPSAVCESGEQIEPGSLETIRSFFTNQIPLSNVPGSTLSALLHTRNLDDEARRKQGKRTEEDEDGEGEDARRIAAASASSSSKSLFQLVLVFARRLAASSTVAAIMLESTELPVLLPLLPKLYSTRHFFVFLELLWDLFEIEQGVAEQDGVSKIDQIAKPSCIAALGDTLRNLMISARDGQPLKQLRNDVLVLVSLVSSNAKCAPVFVESHVLEQLVRYVTSKSHPTHHPDVKKLHLTQCTEDFELHKMLVSAVTRLAVVSEKAMQVALSGNFLAMLFSYLDTRPSGERKRAWSDAQYEELQLQALSSLAVVIPHALEEYRSLRGNTQLLKFLEWTMQPTEPSLSSSLTPGTARLLQGTGNSFHATGDLTVSATGTGVVSRSGNGRRTHACLCLRALLATTTQGDRTVNRDLSDQGALSQLIEIFDAKSTAAGDKTDLRMRADALLVCSALCADDLHNKELFGAAGVHGLVPYLRCDPQAIDASPHREDLFIAAVDCVSGCVIGCRLTEQTFLEEEGMFHLLDILAACQERFQRLVLSTLVDLCEADKALAHSRLWRHSEDETFTAAHLMISLWEQESQRMHVETDAGGMLADRPAPLMGEDQLCMPIASDADAEDASPAIADIFSNNRANIYAMLCLLGIEETADTLEPKGQVTLAVVDSYLTLKRGEVWMEMAEELGADGIDAIEEDKEVLRLAIEANKDVIVQVREIQSEILSAGEAETLHRERTDYEGMKQHLRNQDKAKADFESFLRRTQDFEALRTAKKEQLAAIDKSRTS